MQIGPPRGSADVAVVVVRYEYVAAAILWDGCPIQLLQVVEFHKLHVCETSKQSRHIFAGRPRFGYAVAGHDALREDTQRLVVKRCSRRTQCGQASGPGASHELIIGLTLRG